jgi:NAD(P)H-dependent FMN reductase
LAARTINSVGAKVDFATMAEFDAPSFDADVEIDEGLPSGAESFRERLVAADAFVICSPEYNASMPGLLKNAIDWISRYSPQPFNELQGLLISASPSMIGGNRGLWALRVPLEHLSARIYPQMCSLAQAHQAFADDGTIENAQLQERFVATITDFVDLVEAATHYPCIKKEWVEYLGQQPDPLIDRVEHI